MIREVRRTQNSKQDKIQVVKSQPSVNSLREGQEVIYLSRSNRLERYRKELGRLWVSYMDTDNNYAVNNDLSIGGDLDVGGMISKQVMVFYHPFNATGTGKVYLPWSSISEASSINYYNNLIAPYSGRLLKVVARSAEALGSTVIGFHKASDGTESPSTTATETITVDMSVDDTSYTFDFTESSSFSSGDVVAISIDPSNTPNDSRVTSVWLFNNIL